MKSVADYAVEYGLYFEKTVLWFAHFLIKDGAAGSISLGLLLVLVISLAIFVTRHQNRVNLLKSANKILTRTKTREEFSADLGVVKDLQELGKKGLARSEAKSIIRAWEEYGETLVRPESSGNGIVRNTVRPQYFFNSHDLGFETGFWRLVPSLFVTVGLFLTFIGIISAIAELTTANGGEAFDTESMKNFLSAAKAKFLMSLTGLFCSIVFTFFYRIYHGKQERALHVLCDEIERRVLFQTPESIATKQLEAIIDQSDQLKQFNNELAAQLGQTLGVELPKSISNALSEQLGPVLEKVANSSETSVTGMVTSLGDSLHEKLNSSLEQIAETLNGVNTSLLQLSKELGNSGQNVATEVNTAVAEMSTVMEMIRHQFEEDAEKTASLRSEETQATQNVLSDLLTTIEKNTRQGADVLKDASSEISEAARHLKDTIESAGEAASEQASRVVQSMGQEAQSELTQAGQHVAQGIAGISESIIGEATAFQEGLQNVLAGPIQKLEISMKEMSSSILAANSGLERHGSSVERLSAANEAAARHLNTSAETLTNVSQPILQSVQNIQLINSNIKQSLENGVSALSLTKDAVESSMSALLVAVENFDDTIGDAEDLDNKLQLAFGAIKIGLEQAQNQIREYSTSLEAQYSSGLASLTAAIDGLDDFTPPRRR